MLHPAWSYQLNADYEDHAEHEYMTLVAEHPEWEQEKFTSAFEADYGSFDSRADLFNRRPDLTGTAHNEVFSATFT